MRIRSTHGSALAVALMAALVVAPAAVAAPRPTKLPKADGPPVVTKRLARAANWGGGSLSCPGETQVAYLTPPNWSSNPTRWFAQRLWVQIYSKTHRRWYWHGTEGENRSRWFGPWRAGPVGVVELIRTSNGAVTEFKPFYWKIGFRYGDASYVRGYIQVTFWDAANRRWGPVRGDYVTTYGVQAADAPGYCFFL